VGNLCKIKVMFIVGKNKVWYSLGEKLEMLRRHIHKHVVKSALSVRNGVSYGVFKRCTKGCVDWRCQCDPWGQRRHNDGFHGDIR